MTTWYDITPRVSTPQKRRLVILLSCLLFFLLAHIDHLTAQSVTTAPAPSEESATVGGEFDNTTAPDEMDDLDLLNLDVPEVQIVVTASRREQKITTVPYAVSVITADDIRWSGARNVPDALRLVPGIDVAEIAYGVEAVSPRGLQSFLNDCTLVLVDGRQIYDSFFGGTPWGSFPFQLEDIARIEVIRGPGGVTWGANAANGVINIITKDPKDQMGLTVTGGGGSRGTHKEHLGYAWADEKLRIRVSGEYEASDGFDKGFSLYPPLDDSYMAGRVGVHAIYDAGPNDTVMISGGTGMLNNGFPPGLLDGFHPPNTGSDDNYVLGKWTHTIAKDNTFELTGFVNDFAGKPGVPAADYRYQQLALQFSHTFKPNEAHTIIWGIDNRVDLFDATNADPFLLTKDYLTTEIVGIYFQDEWRFAPRWALNLGARVDYDSYGGFQPSGRAALSYELTDASMVYGAVSRAFHMPTSASRFITMPLVDGLACFQGHQDIDAITLIAYELGYRATWFDKLDTNVNFFWHEFSDMTTVTAELGPPGLITFDYNNRADTSVYGVELDAKYRVNKQLTLLANYTFEHVNWRSEAAYSDLDAMTAPEHKFMTGIRYSPTEDIHLSSHLYYVDSVEAPDPFLPIFTEKIPQYFRLDMRGEHEFWDDRASIAVGVRNLLDPEHREGTSSFFSGAEVPRMVYAEMRVSFQ